MTVPTLFMTGVTGYAGGDALFAIANAHPDWSITCLVRNSSKGDKVARSYPKIRFVYDDLNSVDLMKEEARIADIVLHFADSSDNVMAANAIAAGMASKHLPGFWIHTSGTGILFYPDVDRKVYGELAEKVWDDVEDIDEINSIPDHALHRDVDKIVLAAGERGANTKTAIVCPPAIYGVGRGPDSTRSAQLPILTRSILERKRGFGVGAGNNVWSFVHIQDLSKMYLALAEAAVDAGGTASWGLQGYYYAAAFECTWGALAASVTRTAHRLGFLASDEVDSVDGDEAAAVFVYGAMMWGTNSRSRPSRARRELGWNPTMGRADSEKALTELVTVEAKTLEVTRQRSVDRTSDFSIH